MKSIRNKMFMLLIAVGAMPLIIVMMIVAIVMKSESEEETYKDGMLRNAIVSQHITEQCEKNFHVLNTLALSREIKEYVKEPTSDRRQNVAAILHLSNNIFNDRNIIVLTGAEGKQLIRTDGEELVNVISRKHYQAALKGKEYVSDVIVSMSTGEMIIVMEVPLRDEKGEVIGMLQRNFNLIEVQRYIKEAEDHENRIVIVDREGRKIADSEQDDGESEISEKLKEESRQFGSKQMEEKGEAVLVTYSRNVVTGWTIYVVKPYRYIWEEILLKIVSEVTVGVLMLIVLGIIANRLAYKTTKPIIEIARTAAKIAKGSKTAEKLEITSNDELGQMTEAFNKMRSLRDSYQLESEVDKLTKLYNKTTTEKICTMKLKDWEEGMSETLMAFYIIDLDHFKEVNDTYGHQYGDKVLVEFSNRLRKIFRPNDCVGRFGGDEFIVIIDNLPTTEIIVRKAENIKRIAQELKIEGKTVGISASIGIAIVPPQGTEYETLFKSADEALYQVKESGRNGYRINYAESKGYHV